MQEADVVLAWDYVVAKGVITLPLIEFALNNV